MTTKNTEELEKILQNVHTEKALDYLSENADAMIRSDRPFADYIRELIKSKGLQQQDVFLKADIPELYGYKLIGEQKHTRQRDIILRLCYAADLSLSETQRALKLYGMPQLYAKIPRDACLMIAFNNHPGDIHDVNAFLQENKIEPLRSCGSPE